MKYVFISSAFLIVCLICAMQRFAIATLQRQNASIKQWAADAFVQDALPKMNYTYAVNNTLPEPIDYTVDGSVIDRIDLLLDHVNLDSQTQPSKEWIVSVLAAAREEIRYRQLHAKNPHHLLPTCTR